MHTHNNQGHTAVQSHFDRTYMSHHPAAADTDDQQNLPQCRICLDGPDPDLGRLIRPCLCSGTVSVCRPSPSLQPLTQTRAKNLTVLLQHVHLACLQRWRNTSANASAFFVCPQCHYRYRFARTKIVGLATNSGSCHYSKHPSLNTPPFFFSFSAIPQ